MINLIKEFLIIFVVFTGILTVGELLTNLRPSYGEILLITLAATPATIACIEFERQAAKKKGKVSS